ncbi:SRPBCC domain-containing protein [Arthrobacter sp. zg-Y769]|uniref:SRPBCC domain-containing protein n=1 Tax=Arthrobacter sp. zg-Y769 TaxID=2894191 RepID=UPI001E6578EC|nr:SRPBCC domain-containing protein [Arthrobacter sp. zg-Y769]MCC9206540.1 SRPBCC domain-containing protein [Arthrobacter sp. zg-Y769]
MSPSLFSHAAEPDPDRTGSAHDTAVPDVVAVRQVPRDAEEAFNGFTDYLHLWWPEDLTDFGEGTHMEFEGGVLTETGPDGDTSVWATVRTREPDTLLELDWVAGQDPRHPTDVRVDFSPVADGSTLVTLRHSGLERLTEPAREYERLQGEWAAILDRYARFMGAR